jgi:hypothetical protein
MGAPRRRSLRRGPTTRRPFRPALLAALVLAAAPPARATEQFLVNTGAPLIYDPFTIEDARTAGMGRVTAIPSDGVVAAWWNPAFLALRGERGLSISNADLAEVLQDGYIRSATIALPLRRGDHPLGVGLGVKRLSVGEIGFVFPGDTVRPWEQAYVASIGYGVSASTAIGVSLEYVWLHYDPDPALNIPGSLSAFSASVGIGYERTLNFSAAGGDSENRLLVTPTAAATFQHLGQQLDYPGEGQDLYRQLRGAVGVEVEYSPPEGTEAFDAARLGQFALATAIEAWVPATDWAEISLDRTVIHCGTELTLFGVLSGRLGFINDNLNNRVEWEQTHGLGISLPEGLPVIVRFDWAEVPWGGSERIERRTLSISLR